MFEDERKISILNRIQADGKVLVSVLAKKYDVSESTIRRDLTSLEKSGFIKRTHGGAILQGSANKDYFYNQKKHHFVEEKQTIAQIAASLVEPNTTIFLGTSTSTNLMAEQLNVPNVFSLPYFFSSFQWLARLGHKNRHCRFFSAMPLVFWFFFN